MTLILKINGISVQNTFRSIYIGLIIKLLFNEFYCGQYFY